MFLLKYGAETTNRAAGIGRRSAMVILKNWRYSIHTRKLCTSGFVKLGLIVASCRGFLSQVKVCPPVSQVEVFPVFFSRADFKDVLGRMSWKPFGVVFGEGGRFFHTIHLIH